jgi:hypothetical protein
MANGPAIRSRLSSIIGPPDSVKTRSTDHAFEDLLPPLNRDGFAIEDDLARQIAAEVLAHSGTILP